MGGKSPRYPFLDGILHPKKRAFLIAYCENFNLTQTARQMGLSRQCHYDWLHHDEQYREAFEEAKKVAAETLEAELVRRAFFGVRKLKFYKDQLIMVPCSPDDPEAITTEEGYVCPYIEHEFSDTLGIFLLKGAMPEKYRERYEYHEGDRQINETIEQELEKLANRKAPRASRVNPAAPASPHQGNSAPEAS